MARSRCADPAAISDFEVEEHWRALSPLGQRRDGKKPTESRQGEGGSAASSLPCGKEPGVGAAGTDCELHPPRAARAVADVGRAVAIGVDPGVDVAAGEMHAEEGLGPVPTARVGAGGV